MTNEVGPYVEHRMKLTGSDLLVFEPEALEAIAMASSGVRGDCIAHYSLYARKIEHPAEQLAAQRIYGIVKCK